MVTVEPTEPTPKAEPTELDTLAMFRLRPVKGEDRACIMDSWIRSYASAIKVKKHRRQFWAATQAEIEAILCRDDSKVGVLCKRGEPDHIAGWIAFSQVGDVTILHYVYIKRVYRPLRLFWRLMGAAGVDAHSRVLYTFDSKKARKLSERFAASEHFPIEELTR